MDITRARAQLDQVRAIAPVLEAQRQAALFRLAALTGRPPAEFPKVVAGCIAPPRLRRPIPVGDGAALLRRRPDVRQAERGLAAATARIGVATTALYPSISLGANVGSTGFVTDIGQPAANRWSFGPLISWTLPSGGERARIREANAAADAAFAKFDGVVLTALRETETDLSTYARDLDRNAELRAARDEAAQAQAQAQRLYRAGRSPYLAGLDAQRTLATTEAALATSDGQVAADQVKLFLSLGGGWGPAT
jgi:outer membrane protein TolC